MHFCNTSIGYVVGDNGTILKTTNAGNNWLSLTSSFSNYMFWDVCFINVDTGYICGEANPGFNPYGSGIILKTTNGGSSWSTIYTNSNCPIRDIFILNKDTLFACGGAEQTNSVTIKSTNAGVTWNQIGPSFFDAMLGGLYFKNSNDGFLGVYESVFGNINPTSTTWLNTNNGGNSFSTNVVPNSSSYWVFASDFPNQNYGYMTRGTYVTGYNNYLRKTSNGGTNWVENLIPSFTGGLYGIDFIDTDTGYIAGEGGKIQKTIDGGMTFNSQNSNTTETLRDIQFLNSNFGFSVGDNGTIRKYSPNACSNTYATVNEISCFNYITPSGNHTFNNSGTYHDTIPNLNGCDSILTINLTINSVDTTITISGSNLISNQANATYQWINCDSLPTNIIGATNQIFTGAISGQYYKVAVTKNGCTGYSDCTLFSKTTAIDNANIEKFIKINPNPTNGKFSIINSSESNEISFYIINSIGQNVYNTSFSNNKITNIDISNVPNGVYFIIINSKNKFIKTFKIIKSGY